MRSDAIDNREAWPSTLAASTEITGCDRHVSARDDRLPKLPRERPEEISGRRGGECRGFRVAIAGTGAAQSNVERLRTATGREGINRVTVMSATRALGDLYGSALCRRPPWGLAGVRHRWKRPQEGDHD